MNKGQGHGELSKVSILSCFVCAGTTYQDIYRMGVVVLA